MPTAALQTVVTSEDVRALVKSQNEDGRARAAHKICRQIEGRKLTEAERAAAEDIIRIMAADATELVRRALAVTLRNSPKLPRDVAMKLAADVDSIALPVIASSPVFSDDDLIAIVRNSESSRQNAVAARQNVPARVVDAVVQFGDARAVKTAAGNPGAVFSEQSLGHALERFPTEQDLADTVAHRAILPVSIAERLVNMVSDSVRDHLVNHHELSPETAIEIALGARERATIDLVEQAVRASDVVGFIQHLKAHNRMTPSLILRALCQGHMRFCEYALADLAHVPHHRAWLMIHDAGPLGLRSIYERSGLPPRLYSAFRVAIDVYHSMEMDGRAGDQERFMQRMMQRVLTHAHGMSRGDVDYLLDKMDRLSADSHILQVA
jgi:uncharacterized protein (DUF2336 family)